MSDDLSDIDPVLIEAVGAHANAFVDADARVDEIISWGVRELAGLKEQVGASGGTVGDFTSASAEIDQAVKSKLKTLEDGIRAMAAEPAASSE